MHAWLAAWAATSAALAAWAWSVEATAVIAACVYIGANALAVGSAHLRRPRYADRLLTGLGWAAAAQLPVMVVVFFDRDNRPRLAADRPAPTGRPEVNPRRKRPR